MWIFKKLYPGEKMIIFTNNTPYYHRREVGLLGGGIKREICEMMVKYNVKQIDLPLKKENVWK